MTATDDYGDFSAEEYAALEREARGLIDPAEAFAELLGAALNRDAASDLINSLSEVADADAIASLINNNPNYFTEEKS